MENKKENTDLSIVIVSWNVRDLLRENLKALFKNRQNINFEVFVIDNDSRDRTHDMVKKEFPLVNLIINNYNAGFARANNQGIKKACGRYILLLNPDMRVLPNALENMVSWMDKHQEAGIASCNLLNEKEESITNVRRFPEIFDQLVIVIKLPHLFPALLDTYLMKNFDYKNEASVDSVRGSFFIIRRAVVDKIGLLDERYFLWFEEVDYCQRVKKAGWKIYYTPEAKCINYIGESFSQLPRSKAQRYFRDSMLKYFKKWKPGWQYWVLKSAWLFVIFLVWISSLINLKGKSKT